MKKSETGFFLVVIIFLTIVLTTSAYSQPMEKVRWIGSDLHFATLERQVMQNKIIVVGTIKSVETQLVDKSFSSPYEYLPGQRFEYQELVPYFFVTIDVEQYLLDKTGKFLPQITFRDLAGGSGIYNGESIQMNYPYRINYTSGEKALFIIHLRDDDFYSIGYQQKFSFLDDDKLQNQSFKKYGYEPFTINQINNEIETFFNSYPPKKLLDLGVVNSEIRCKEGSKLIFKSTDGSPACVKTKSAEKLIERGWAKPIPLVGKNSQVETPIEEKMAPLQECSREHNQQEACPEGYVCYEHLSGGLGPFGALPIEPFGGDKLCHKECFTDNDCPFNAPMCLLTKRTTEDTIEAFFLCFSEEKGKKVRNEKFQSCMESKEKSFQDALEKDEKIFDIRNPPKPHKANFNGVMIQFLPYIVNNLNLDVEEVLKNELQLEIIRMGGLDWIAIVSLPEENVVETLCTFELDNRIMSTSFNIDWERVE